MLMNGLKDIQYFQDLLKMVDSDNVLLLKCSMTSTLYIFKLLSGPFTLIETLFMKTTSLNKCSVAASLEFSYVFHLK